MLSKTIRQRKRNTLASLMVQMVESACNAGDLGLIAESGRFPGVGNGNPLQYCCLENPMDRGSLAVYSPWVAESDTTEPLTLSKNYTNTKVINTENRLVIARDQVSSTGNGAKKSKGTSFQLKISYGNVQHGNYS